MFSKIYDALMSDVDYHLLFQWIKPYIKNDSLILDAGCGSGYLLCELLKEGHQAIGIDLDSSMLSLAYDRLTSMHLPIQLYLHDLRKPLNVKVDVVLMMFDVINYFKGIKSVLKHVYQSLNPQGVFIFDIYKEDIKDEYNQYIEHELDPFEYIWQISKTKQGIKHQFTYEGKTEIIHQYIHSMDYYQHLLTEIGFQYQVLSGPDSRKDYIIAYKK